ncbi:MAG: protein kinase [Alphaproteobacteria bacterium]|nr:protein kinase [Alphaproteobacteria bacterium]
MTRRKRTLFGARSNRYDSVEPMDAPDPADAPVRKRPPMPLEDWARAGHPDDPDDEITEGPEDREGPDVDADTDIPPGTIGPTEDTEPPEPTDPPGVLVGPDEDSATEPTPKLGPDALVGARIGQWTVSGLIGKGDGYSLVAAHHHQSTRIRSTLKILDRDDDNARQRLVREAEILFPLDHPGIANVRNLMLSHDPPFIELQQLRGDRLDNILARRRSLFMAEALDLAEQLLATLAYLHEKEVFHLDLQPRNLMVRPDGGLTLMGFSNAVERVAPTEEVPFGALPYVAPEWPDIRWPGLADLYGAGALLHELLTGQVPFGAPLYGGPLTTALVLNEKKNTPFLDPGARFQEDLRAVVRHLTTREPAGRLTDPSDALGRLQAVERSYAS